MDIRSLSRAAWLPVVFSIPALLAHSEPARSTMCSFPSSVKVPSGHSTAAATLMVKIQCDRDDCLFILVSPMCRFCWARVIRLKTSADEDTLKTLDDASLKAAMRGLAKKGDHRTAYSLLDALPAERRSPLLYHGAITACGRSRPIKGRTAMLLWRRMKEENVTVPRATYNALLHAAQGSLTENATSALLAAMDRDGVALNVVSYAVHESNFAAPAPSTRCLLDGTRRAG